MAPDVSKQCTLNLSRLSWPEVEQEIARCPALIVPLGGLEPYGRNASLGAASAVSRALASALSVKMNILCAPVVEYGCTVPYRSFSGSSGIKPRTLTNLFCETVRGWFMQGFRTVVLIDTLTENSAALELALQRLNNSHPGSSVLLFSLQKEPRVRAFIAKQRSGAARGEPLRTEFGMLSLAAWIDPALVRAEQTGNRKAPVPDPDKLKRWHKRGADPEQFRKYFPDASCSSDPDSYDVAAGGRLFEYILEILEEKTASLLRCTEPHAS